MSSAVFVCIICRKVSTLFMFPFLLYPLKTTSFLLNMIFGIYLEIHHSEISIIHMSLYQQSLYGNNRTCVSTSVKSVTYIDLHCIQAYHFMMLCFQSTFFNTCTRSIPLSLCRPLFLQRILVLFIKIHPSLEYRIIVQL